MRAAPVRTLMAPLAELYVAWQTENGIEHLKMLIHAK
jgi:hypothetical protein